MESLSEKVPDGDYVAETGWDLYYVSLDTLGEITWNSGTYKRAGRPDSHVIEMLTESTPLTYRAYLRKQGVSYILAGTEQLGKSKPVVFHLKNVSQIQNDIVHLTYITENQED